MNINNIHPYQDLQNAIRPDSGNNSVVTNRQVRSDPLIVYDPPFFPMATYQRPDLIHKVGPSATDQGLMKTADKSAADATDTGIRGSPAVSPENIRPGAILTIKA